MKHTLITKNTQRTEIKNCAKFLSDTYCILSDQKIFQSVISLPEYQQASMIFCYVSVGKEADTRSLLQKAWVDGKRTAVPRCIDKGIMKPYEITSFNDLIPGLYHIPEPSESCSLIDLDDIDFAIVPCLSCDRKRNRLGHGGGYYDRTLSKLAAPSAALCRERLLLDKIYCEPHDQKVDILITENTIYR